MLGLILMIVSLPAGLSYGKYKIRQLSISFSLSLSLSLSLSISLSLSLSVWKKGTLVSNEWNFFLTFFYRHMDLINDDKHVMRRSQFKNM